MSYDDTSGYRSNESNSYFKPILYQRPNRVAISELKLR